MTTKNFNANKMLMSAVAAVVFSFVFTTSANASTTPQEKKQVTNLEIRVKTRPNGDSQKKQEQKQEQNKDQKQEQKQENTDVVSKIIQKFGVRVK
jgi:GH35 family endo-1,4-beta-xylanase